MNNRRKCPRYRIRDPWFGIIGLPVLIEYYGYFKCLKHEMGIES